MARNPVAGLAHLPACNQSNSLANPVRL